MMDNNQSQNKTTEETSERKDWKNISSEFTEELRKEWENRGFSYKECKEWVDVGLNAEDAGFANYLKEEGKSPEWCLGNGNIQKLREKYSRGKK